MYKIIIIHEDGSESVRENVLSDDFIDKSLVQNIAKDSFGTELTEEELKDLQADLEYWEELPDNCQLVGLIEDIIKNREVNV